MSLNREKEEFYFKQMQQGDTHAFEYFFKTYINLLYAYALGFLKEKEAAEDVVQEVYVYFWNKRKKIRYTGSVYAYLQRAVKNACINQKLHRQVEERYEQEMQQASEAPHDWQEADQLKELRQKLLDAIDRLPEKSRQVFIMSCVDGLKYKEIARQTGLSENTVKSHIRRSYKRLREDIRLDENDLMVWFMILMLSSGK